MASRWSLGRHPRPDFEPKVQMLGEPTGTAIDDHERQWWGRCCHKRRPENRLMVRGRDPYGSRQRGPRVRRTFESMLRSRNNIAARLLGIAAISSPDLTGRRGSFTRSSLLCCYRPDSQGRSNSRVTRPHLCGISDHLVCGPDISMFSILSSKSFSLWAVSK